MLRHFDLIGERRAADRSQIELYQPMRFSLQKSGDTGGRVELSHMALAIIKAQRMQLEALLLGDRRRGGGIDAAA